MANVGGEQIFFQNIHIINVNVSHLFFQKSYGDKIWAAGTFRGVDSFETNDARTGKNII